MILLKRLLANGALAFAMLSSIGCGAGGPSVVSTDMVEGVVTLDGKPLEGATLTFVPVQDGVGAAATGMSDASGKYQLTAVGAGAGAQAGAGTLPGEYYVGVLKVVVPTAPTSAELPSDDSSGTRPQPKDAELTSVVPPRYKDPQESGIKVTVEQGTNNIPIELTSK